MSRPASTNEKRRLTIELPKATRELMDVLREQTGAESITEVIRRALAVYAAILSLDHEVRLVVVDPDGKETEVLIPRGMI